MSNKWVISIVELYDKNVQLYKVTKRFADYSVSETKVFRSKAKAFQQIEEWSEQI
jgi:hypothetical protein